MKNPNDDPNRWAVIEAHDTGHSASFHATEAEAAFRLGKVAAEHPGCAGIALLDDGSAIAHEVRHGSDPLLHVLAVMRPPAGR